MQPVRALSVRLLVLSAIAVATLLAVRYGVSRPDDVPTSDRVPWRAGLTIERKGVGCLGPGPHELFEISSEGAVRWHRLDQRGRPIRVLQVPPAVLFALHQANSLPDDDAGPNLSTYDEWLHVDRGWRIDARSSRGAALTDVLARAVTAYAPER